MSSTNRDGSFFLICIFHFLILPYCPGQNFSSAILESGHSPLVTSFTGKALSLTISIMLTVGLSGKGSWSS